jgi:hypothetical protein
VGERIYFGDNAVLVGFHVGRFGSITFEEAHNLTGCNEWQYRRLLVLVDTRLPVYVEDDGGRGDIKRRRVLLRREED